MNYYEDEIDIRCFRTNKNLNKPELEINIENPIEKATYILKKGYSIQQLGYLTNLHSLMNDPHLLEHIFSLIIENLSLWEKPFLEELALSFCKIFDEKIIPNEILNEIDRLDIPINQIIKIMFTIISKNPPKDVDNFIIAFKEMVGLLSKTNKIRVNKENIDFANDLGSFGKSTECRRYSVYFCINKVVNEDLLKRLTILESDYEQVIRTEISHHFRYLLKEHEQYFLTTQTVDLMKSYLSENDIILNTETLVSIFMNFDKLISLSPQFIDNIIKKVVLLIEDKEDINYINNIVQSTINYCVDHTPKEEIIELICIYIEEEGQKNLKVKMEFIIHAFNDISKIMLKISKTMKYKSIISKLFNYIINNVYNDYFAENNELNFSIEDKKEECDFKEIFYEKICKVLEFINIQEQNKIWSRVFDIFEFHEKELIKFFIINLEGLIVLEQSYLNETFFIDFFCNIEKIDHFLDDGHDLHLLQCIFNALLQINFTLFKEKCLEITKRFSIKYIHSKFGIEIEKKAIKLLVKSMKYSNRTFKKDMIFLIERDFYTKKGYYLRRIYFEFYAELANTFSIKFLESYDTLEKILSFLSDNYYIQSQALKLLEFLIPLISDTLISKIITIVKELKIKKFKDIELIKSIEKFEFWYSYYSNNKNSSIMINKKNLDKKKLEEENNLLKIEEAETKEKDKDKSEGLDDFIKRIRPKKVTEKSDKYINPLFTELKSQSSSLPMNTNLVKKTSIKSGSGKGIGIFNDVKTELKKKNTLIEPNTNKNKIKDSDFIKAIVSPVKKNSSTLVNTKKPSELIKTDTSDKDKDKDKLNKDKDKITKKNLK